MCYAHLYNCILFCEYYKVMYNGCNINERNHSLRNNSISSRNRLLFPQNVKHLNYKRFFTSPAINGFIPNCNQIFSWNL